MAQEFDIWAWAILTKCPNYLFLVSLYESVTVAARSEGVGLHRSDTGIVGSIPAQGMDVCVFLCCAVLCR
jgi:hypothetical protein